ncbi:hypothetical protein BDV25DRAFT_171487 [Aspergillus avenaceus]|uniref:Rhodopsin domain-containing protein n=1 Tax=Aspergillus avenaceus TaxID=36643 RepID=A0A5N6U7T2_ASPAV|nr:hypothetical protein BDV25DRAFT_171487 [Aspergillus avenaceus]
MAGGENRSWVIETVSWPLFGLSAVLVVLRLWTRTRIIRSLGWDDAFIILALVCACVNSIMITISAHYGTGRHANTLTEYQQIMSTKYNWLSQGFHVMSSNWGKVSVAMFLLRIIRKVKHHKMAICGGMVLLTIINVVCVYTIYGQCTPTAKLWDTSVDGSCWDPGVQKNYAFFQGSSSAFSDLVLALYPLHTIYGLQMARKVKFGLATVLSLGIFAMVAAIIKTINLASLSARADYPWKTVDLAIWIEVEQYLIIIAACIPTLTPLFNIAIYKRSSKRNASSGKKVYTGPQYGRSDGYAQFGSRPGQEYPLDEYSGDIWTTRKDGDGNSDDPIITEEGGQGIMKTTEIHIQTGSMAERNDSRP